MRPLRSAVVAIVAASGCASTFATESVLPVVASRPCPVGEDAELRLRHRRGGDGLVSVDGGPERRGVTTCVYEVSYPEPGCPAEPRLSITRVGVVECPSLAAAAPLLIEAHGLASSPCASVKPERLVRAVREESCAYRVTTRTPSAVSSGPMSWVVLR